jgi:hypothetical protein
MKALIFDLDGTLVDSVYAHVSAWQLAFAEAGIPLDGWRLHRRMGMSGGLFKRAVMRELGRTISMPRLKALDRRHGELFRKFLPKELTNQPPGRSLVCCCGVSKTSMTFVQGAFWLGQAGGQCCSSPPRPATEEAPCLLGMPANRLHGDAKGLCKRCLSSVVLRTKIGLAEPRSFCNVTRYFVDGVTV